MTPSAYLGPNVPAVKGAVSNLADLDRLYAGGEGQTRKPRHPLRQCWGGNPPPLGKITAEHIRQNLRHQREGDCLHGAEGVAADQRGGSIILTAPARHYTGAPASASTARARRQCATSRGPGRRT